MGGQAVIEGVLMRSPHGFAVAIRHPHDGKIVVNSQPYTPLTRRVKFLGLPFLRGVASLFEMMFIGIKALNYSVSEWETSMRIKEGQENQDSIVIEEFKNSDHLKENRSSGENLKQSGGNSLTVAFTIALGLGLAIFLMVILPNLLTSLVGRIWHEPAPTEATVTYHEGTTETRLAPSERSALVEEQHPFLYNIISGCFRAIILLLYIVAISFIKDVRRVFEYHGAEHKAVYAFEKEGAVSVEAAEKYTTHHPRCGTSFLAVVILVSIVVFALIAQGVAALWPGFTTLPFLLKKLFLIGLHILFLPLVAGSAYEIIKISSKYYDKFWGFRLLVYPGLLFQRITTREPDKSQLEVAVESLKAALDLSRDNNKEKGIQGNV